jgi:hypothetical protein
MARIFEISQSIKEKERKKEIDKFKQDQKTELDKFKHSHKTELDEVKNSHKAEIDRLTEVIELLKKEHSTGKKPKNQNEEVTAVQLLIFHYLGFLQQINVSNNKIKAQFLSKIFNTEGWENIRKKLSNTGGRNSKLLTKKNLEKVCGILEAAGLGEALKKAKKDLDKTSSK